MKSEVSCLRCHTRISVPDTKISRTLKCPHCNLRMKINARTQRLERRISIILVSAVGAVLFWGMKSFEKGNYMVLVFGLTLATSLIAFIDRICLWIVDRLYGLEYEEYHDKKK